MTYEDIRRRVIQEAAAVEFQLLAQALAANGHNISKTAEALDCAFSTLRRALERHPDLLAKCGGPGRPRTKDESTKGDES